MPTDLYSSMEFTLKVENNNCKQVGLLPARDSKRLFNLCIIPLSNLKLKLITSISTLTEPQPLPMQSLKLVRHLCAYKCLVLWCCTVTVSKAFTAWY